MFKKRTAFFLLSIAYAILLAHNIIPHHHHEHSNDHHHSNHTEAHNGMHTHDGEQSEGHAKDLFLSNLEHPIDGFSTTGHSVSNSFSKQLVLSLAILTGSFSISGILKKSPAYYYVVDTIVYNLAFAHSHGLRAPPVA